MRSYLPAAALSIVLVGSLTAAEPAPTGTEIRAAVAKALPLIRKGSAGHMAARTCFACHHQAIPILAMTAARSHGSALDEEDVRKHLRFIADFLDRNRANYLKGRGQGGQIDTAGYALWTLEMGGWKPDQTTAAVVEYLLLHSKDLDHWQSGTSNRPPSEASSFTANYLAVRALQTFGTPAQRERIDRRIRTVRGWLTKTPARDTEDRVFRLWALQTVGAEGRTTQAAAAELIRTQRPDGGWAQIDTLESDAYATGTALVALHEASGLTTTDAVYQRGLKHLLTTQHTDGSWHVHSRSKPFQTYFESGFPHGKDQFISLAASSWATTALALALPSARPPLTDIGSGRLLNDCLNTLQELHKHSVYGPKIALDKKLLTRINVTRGEDGGDLGLLTKGGPLSWPGTLNDDAYEQERKRIEKRIPQAVEQAKKGEVAAALTEEISQALTKMRERLDQNVTDLTPYQYVEGRRYLRRLDATVKALRQKDVRDYFTAAAEIPVKCPAVRELVQYLTEKKLRMAPAAMGDESAYVDLHKAMIEYIKQTQAKRDKK